MDQYLARSAAYVRSDKAWKRYGAFAQTGTGTAEQRMTALREALLADEAASAASRAYDSYLQEAYS